MRILPFNETYDLYLRDESKKVGSAVSISFPTSSLEVCDIVKEMAKSGIKITTQGGRTGITAGCVPIHSHILNLERMDKAISIEEQCGSYYLTLMAGVRLSSLRNNFKDLNHIFSEEDKITFQAMRKQQCYEFLPNPSETSATIGGILATNASGMNGCFVDNTRDFVRKIKVVMPSGEMLTLTRGENYITNNQAKIGNEIYKIPNVNAEGISINIENGMDVVDLFLGTEGTFGITTECEIRLDKVADNSWGLMFFFREKGQGVEFSNDIIDNYSVLKADADILAVEFFNEETLKLLNRKRNNLSKLSELPAISTSYMEGVYVELNGDSDKIEQSLMTLMEIFLDYNDNDSDTWAVNGKNEVEKLHLLRHSIPEMINDSIEKLKIRYKEAVKIATDFTLPKDKLKESISMYEKSIDDSGLQGYVFGHAFDCHMHVNIIVTSEVEKEAALKLIDEWSRFVVLNHGKIISENGIGKLKKQFVAKYYKQQLETLQEIKGSVDKKNILLGGIL